MRYWIITCQGLGIMANDDDENVGVDYDFGNRLSE